jgi:HlyD family secretion protein
VRVYGATVAKDQLSSELASLRLDRDDRPASFGLFKWLLMLLVVIGLTGLAYFVALPYVEARLFKTAVTLTEVSLVSPAQASIELTATGYVVADRKSRVAPKVPGRVLGVHVQQGSEVRAGDKLLELDPSDDRAAILAAESRAKAARAQAMSARARIATAQAELADAKQRAQRERRLANDGISAPGAAEDLDARVAALQRSVEAAEAEARAADAEAAALAAQVAVLEVSMGNLLLTAPINGRVINRPPQLGEFVGPQPPGVSVDMGGVEIADFTTLLVELDVPEQRLGLIRVGAPAEIVLDAFPQKRFRGRAKEITPQVDRAKATVVVKAEFVDPPAGVLPDMAARVSFLSSELDQEAVKQAPKVIVPTNAIAQLGGSQVVFTLEGDRVRIVPIKTGPAFGTGFELLEGPAPGTQLISNPPPTLADGDRIKEKTDDE